MIKVSVLGRITKDIELKQLPSGTSTCNFAIATSSNAKDSEGKRISEFLDCKAFGKTAETIAKYFHKGDAIMAYGELQSHEWTDKNEIKRKIWQMLLNDFEFVPKSKDDAPKDASAVANEPKVSTPNVPNAYVDKDKGFTALSNEEDLPF